MHLVKNFFFLAEDVDSKLLAAFAKALGQALAARLPRDVEILCLDRVKAAPGSYMDVGAPVGAAFPVVVKTLVLGSQ